MLTFGNAQNSIRKHKARHFHTLTDPTFPAAASGQSLGGLLVAGLPAADSLDILSTKNRRVDATGDIIVDYPRTTLLCCSEAALNVEAVTARSVQALRARFVDSSTRWISNVESENQHCNLDGYKNASGLDRNPCGSKTNESAACRSRTHAYKLVARAHAYPMPVSLWAS